MASTAAASLEDDDALLVLIHQHLKRNGFLKAAEVLERHVPQVEATQECSNLHEIYTSWMKLCPLTQRAKQETKDSDTLEENGIKPETTTSGEGGEKCADFKLPDITVDDEDDVKDSLDIGAEGVELTWAGADTEKVSEQLPDAAGEMTSHSEDKLLDSSASEGEETKMEKESPPSEVFAEASNGAESCDAVQITQIDPEQDRPQEPAEACGSNGERREETKRDDDEPEQEPEETMDPTNVTAETSVSQTEVTAFCSEDEEDEEDGVAEQLDSAKPTSSDLTPPEANGEPVEHEAPPPAEPQSERPEEEELEISKGSADTSTLKAEGQMKTSTNGPHSTETVTVAAAAAQADPEDLIILNIQGEDGDAAQRETSQLLPEAAELSCHESKPPKKKKKKRSKKETAAADTQAPDISTKETLSDAPLSTSSTKKKKRDKSRREEVAEEEAPSEKKVGKKRKRGRNKVEEKTEETSVVRLENKRKKLEDVEEENPESLTEKKKRKRSKRRGQEKECEQQPAGGDKDTQEEVDATDGNSSQTPLATKKHRLRKKLSLQKRMRLHKKDGRRLRRKHNDLAAGQTVRATRKRQRETEEAPQPKPPKRAQPDSAQEDDAPKKKKRVIAEQKETWKENQPPKTKQKKKVKEEEESGVVSDLSTEIPEGVPSPNRRKKKKKTTKAGEYEDVSQDLPAKKKKKKRIKEEVKSTDPTADCDNTPLPASTKKKSLKRKIVFD